jgi:hypothetical protein
MEAVEVVLAGGDITKPITSSDRNAVEDCVWNFAGNDCIDRMVSLIQKYRKKPQALQPEQLLHVSRDARLDQKIKLSPEYFADRLRLMMNVVDLRRPMDIDVLGDSLFQLTPAE